MEAEHRADLAKADAAEARDDAAKARTAALLAEGARDAALEKLGAAEKALRKQEPTPTDILFARLAVDQKALAKEARPAAVQALLAAELSLLDARSGSHGPELLLLRRHRPKAAVPLLIRVLGARGDTSRRYGFEVDVRRSLAALTGWPIPLDPGEWDRMQLALDLARRWERERDRLEVDIERMTEEQVAVVVEAALCFASERTPWMEKALEPESARNGLRSIGLREGRDVAWVLEDLHPRMTATLLDEAIGSRRWPALELLVTLRRAGLTEDLHEIAADPARPSPTRLAAALACWRAGGPIDVDAVMTMARSATPRDDRLLAVVGLEGATRDDAAELLDGLIDLPDAELSRAALGSLAGSQSPSATDRLLRRLAAGLPDDDALRLVARSMATRKTGPAQEGIARALEAYSQRPDRNRYVQAELVRALCYATDRPAPTHTDTDGAPLDAVDTLAEEALAAWRERVRR